jgi:hypothetical protein
MQDVVEGDKHIFSVIYYTPEHAAVRRYLIEHTLVFLKDVEIIERDAEYEDFSQFIEREDDAPDEYEYGVGLLGVHDDDFFDFLDDPIKGDTEAMDDEEDFFDDQIKGNDEETMDNVKVKPEVKEEELEDDMEFM